MIVAATTGAIAFAIAVALLAVLCRRRYLKKVRRTTYDPFLDLDGEMVAVSQPLIIGDGPGPSRVVYSDPYTDDSRPVTQSRTLSLTAGNAVMMMESNNTSRAVVGTDPSPSPSDPTGGLVAEYRNQPHQTDQPHPTGIARSRSHQSLPQVQTQLPPSFPVPQPSNPTFNAGALANVRHNGPTTDRNLPSPGHYSPGNAEDPMLTSAFNVATELSPQYSIHLPPLTIDETWRNSPDPIKTSSSYRQPSFSRRQSFTPNISGYDPADTTVIAPIVSPMQDLGHGLPSPPSEYSASPHTIRGGNFASRPSPITEVVETPSRPKDEFDRSGTYISTRSDTSRSSPVVMTAERVQLTRGPASLTSLAYKTSLGPSTDGRYGESLPPTGATNEFPKLPPPPLPQLPQVQPLTLGKKRLAQGPP